MSNTTDRRWDRGLLFRGCLAVLGWLAATGPAWPQGYPPAEAARHMRAADGFRVRPVAAEPLIRKPVAIEFDERGRLWVIQYLQYPNPAGLKRVQVDRYSRTVYDRVPEPPPHGPRGADRITILEDNGPDPRRVKAKDFVSGLNLATGIAFGHGGVFVLQTPYLLFYPDRNRDDVPDGDPEVLVSGFGMEDAHSVANSLTWGPDGWLYGCQGSTVTAHIRGLEFQQGVWRYHPLTHRFELFCEGGGNSWGLDFDRYGDLLYSTNVGGYCMLHGVQGGYYWKQFGKHGALHNPYTYGYFDHVPHRGFRGGHVTVGGIVYRGDSFPPPFRGKYIAADLLGHNVYWHDLEPCGTTFRAAYGGTLLEANDTWFAPSDVALGPDGAVYVADGHDRRTAHPDPDAEWDRRGGRVYKIEAVGGPSPSPPPPGARGERGFDLAKLSSDQLVQLLAHSNGWYVRQARRLLADRRDPEVIFPLRTLITESKDDQLALEALWALYVSGGFDEPFAAKLLGHRNPHVRRWTVRLLSDDNRVSPELARRLEELATVEPDVGVRGQLACTAKRLPARDGLPIVCRIARRDLDGQDPFIPLLLWWAVERHAVEAADRVLESFASPTAWETPLIRDAILDRLMRRYAAEGTGAGYQACARLLASAPSARDRGRMLAALDQGLQERKREAPVPPALTKLLAERWTEDTTNTTLISLMTRLGHPGAHDRAVQLAVDSRTPTASRLALLRLLGEAGRPTCVAPLLSLLPRGSTAGPPEDVQLAALAALQRFDRDETAADLLRAYPHLSRRVRARAVEVLLSRKRWAGSLLQAVDQGRLAAQEISVEQLRQVALHQDRQLDDLVRKHWGNIQGGTPEEKLAEIRRLNNDLRAGSGDLRRGRELFKNRCASCHRLFDEGNSIGPDLTHANRKDRDFLLVSIVDPSAVIRKEYLSYQVHTTDGRVLTGLIVEQTPAGVTLLDARNERTRIARAQIEAIRESPVSLMPENLLKDLRPQELRDLFSYLQQ